MLHTCAARFDVAGILKKFLDFVGTKQGLVLKVQVFLLSM